MSINSIVVSFGSPRSGTNFMAHALESLEGVFTSKLPEARALHPCQHPKGLLELSWWMQRKHLVLVRTIRNPLEIAESFVSLRDGRQEGGGQSARRTDSEVVKFIRNESENMALQRPLLLGSGYPHQLVEVRYEDLAREEERRKLSLAVTINLPKQPLNEVLLMTALGEFGRKPIPPGRLSRGLGRVMEPEHRQWFATELVDVMEREGYA